MASNYKKQLRYQDNKKNDNKNYFQNKKINNKNFLIHVTIFIGYRERHPALGYFSFSNFFKLLVAKI